MKGVFDLEFEHDILESSVRIRVFRQSFSEALHDRTMTLIMAAKETRLFSAAISHRYTPLGDSKYI